MDTYRPEAYATHLESGESVPPANDETIIELSYQENSRIVPITTSKGVSEQSVFIHMEPSGYVEPVVIVDREAEFTVRTVEGSGTLFVQRIGSDVVRRVRLRNGRKHTLSEGDAYGYISKGDRWIVRDDCKVPFKPEMEDPIKPGSGGERVQHSIRRAHAVRNRGAERNTT